MVPAPPSKHDLLSNQGLFSDQKNLDLHSLLLAIAQQPKPYHQRKHKDIHELNTFSGRTANDLQAFIFQCQIYFRACENNFITDSEKIYFVISYLRGIALNYFKPYINKPNLSQSLDFLEDQLAFVQKLSNIFGSYSLEDNNEDAIVVILFLADEKAINYFIYFVKYQNQIRQND